MEKVQIELWPQLERFLGKKLISENTGCFFGKGKRFQALMETVLSSSLDVEQMEISEAKREFPQFCFEGAEAVLKDRTGGLIAAREVMESLAQSAREYGVKIMEKRKVLGIEPGAEGIAVITEGEVFWCKRLIVTAGPWVGKLLPQLKPRLMPVRQLVAYISMERAEFPHWASIEDHALFYGLPEIGKNLLKISEHRSQGEGDDPDFSSSQEGARLASIKSWINRQMVQPGTIRFTESCFYTSTPTEDFVIQPLSEEPRIIVGAACSGHGFKFAPLTGLALRDLALFGKTNAFT